ncbi:MAG: hypothetical protein PHU03_00675 [Syntrophales bacterium]|nr:hypothetical protein [Syntrophales bacterium]
MNFDKYHEARKIAENIASRVEAPLFYREQDEACVLSRRYFEENGIVGSCVRFLKEKKSSWGHGIAHAEKVAIDAGAIIIIQMRYRCTEPELARQVFLAHMAGLLHDIERSHSNHAQRGALEAGNILKGLKLPDEEVQAVTDAIRNHEAFQPCQTLQCEASQLLSDALYDADKFRWGPDNFTEMLWDILKLRPMPLSRLMERFLPGLEGIEKIRETFRSETGKAYGPDFIDRGIRIGRELYEELKGDFPDAEGGRNQKC